MSFLTKIRNKIHTTPGLRQVAQGYANAFGAGKAFDEYDKKIGYTESGAPAPAVTEQFSPTITRDDLASYATDKYPGTAAMVGHYRQFARATGSTRGPASVAALEDPGDEYAEEFFDEDQGDAYYDEEE